MDKLEILATKIAEKSQNEPAIIAYLHKEKKKNRVATLYGLTKNIYDNRRKKG